jgi:dCMP deaminase
MNKIAVDFSNRRERERPSWDEYFLAIADVVARRSHDPETQVGVVVVDSNRRVIATGYNGFPPGSDDTRLPNLRPDKYPFMVHAEINAIASSRTDLRDSTFYLTYSPCLECAKAIITAGAKEVVYRSEYHNSDHEFIANLLKNCGVNLRRATLGA